MSLSAPTQLRNSRSLRVLIVRTGAMGDVLHAMPAVAAMRLRHPDWQIGWAIEPRWRPLLEARSTYGEAMPLVNRIHEVPTRAWNQRPFSLTTLREILALRRELRAEQYDICVDMQGLLRSAVVGWLAGAELFVGSASPRERPAKWLYRRSIRTQAAHVIDRGCELLGGAIDEPLVAATVPLPVDNSAERWCDELLAKLLPDGAGGRFAMLAPTAGWGAKRWPAQCYGSVAAALAEAGYTTLINAAVENDPFAAATAEASGGRAVPVWCDLAQLTALLRRTSVMIAGDTGPLHLAAALGRPVVALFGPTDPGRTGPYGTRSEVIRHASSREDHRRHPEPEEGLARITVEEVTAAALRVLRVKSEMQGDA
ncbi:lipopolysaccharide heptosyltransferase I [Granulicella arctica]|uniref:Lipopolysaccharide heptosyltransferase 1 n=1 Tax=Granulicella arctica TaxID=940613 RepID=A0A7Y9PG78_9BACT|nr:lipopolysaccharide heptosyltransferase I [Granulicella arctica]NYF79306.1 heptosyltransferase-1 [Granulicella arctica]